MGVPTGNVEVRYLPADRLLVERIIEWQVDHYRPSFPSFDHEDWLDFYGPHMRGQNGPLPVVLGAFDTGECVGTVAIVERDDLDDVDHYTPWIAAMIVDPARRGAGIGTELLLAALGRCRDLYYSRVYLWTHDMGDWYRRIGWTEVEQRVFREVPITIFSLDVIP